MHRQTAILTHDGNWVTCYKTPHEVCGAFTVNIHTFTVSICHMPQCCNVPTIL